MGTVVISAKIERIEDKYVAKIDELSKVSFIF